MTTEKSLRQAQDIRPWLEKEYAGWAPSRSGPSLLLLGAQEIAHNVLVNMPEGAQATGNNAVPLPCGPAAVVACVAPAGRAAGAAAIAFCARSPGDPSTTSRRSSVRRVTPPRRSR